MDSKKRKKPKNSLSFYFDNPWIVVGMITAVGAGLRFYHLGYKCLWLDESISYWVSRGSFSDIIVQNAGQNSAPPAFQLLLHFVSQWSESEIVLRSISFLAGTSAIPATYLLGRRFLSKEASFFCVALVALSQSQVLYSQQVREYSATFLISVMIFFWFDKFLERSDLKNGAFFSLILVTGVFTQYGLSLLMFALNLVFLLTLCQRHDWKSLVLKWSMIQFFVLCSVLVVYQIALKYQMRVGYEEGTLGNAYWKGSWASLPIWAVKNSANLVDFAFPAKRVFLFAFVALFLLAAKYRPGVKIFSLFLTPVLVVLAAACARLYPYYGIRQDIFLMPMIYVMAGLGFESLLRLGKGKWIAIGLIVVLGFMGFSATKSYLEEPGEEPLKGVIASLDGSLKPDDEIYIHYSAKPAFDYYFRSNTNKKIYGVRCHQDTEECFKQLDGILDSKNRLWLVFSHEWGDERERIIEHVAKDRSIRLISTRNEAFLYLLDTDQRGIKHGR